MRDIAIQYQALESRDLVGLIDALLQIGEIRQAIDAFFN